jgi:hypothetical protein
MAMTALEITDQEGRVRIVPEQGLGQPATYDVSQGLVPAMVSGQNVAPTVPQGVPSVYQQLASMPVQQPMQQPAAPAGFMQSLAMALATPQMQQLLQPSTPTTLPNIPSSQVLGLGPQEVSEVHRAVQADKQMTLAEKMRQRQEFQKQVEAEKEREAKINLELLRLKNDERMEEIKARRQLALEALKEQGRMERDQFQREAQLERERLRQEGQLQKLSPGQQLYDSQGNLIAQAPPRELRGRGGGGGGGGGGVSGGVAGGMQGSPSEDYRFTSLGTGEYGWGYGDYNFNKYTGKVMFFPVQTTTPVDFHKFQQELIEPLQMRTAELNEKYATTLSNIATLQKAIEQGDIIGDAEEKLAAQKAILDDIVRQQKEVTEDWKVARNLSATEANRILRQNQLEPMIIEVEEWNRRNPTMQLPAPGAQQPPAPAAAAQQPQAQRTAGAPVAPQPGDRVRKLYKGQSWWMRLRDDGNFELLEPAE